MSVNILVYGADSFAQRLYKEMNAIQFFLQAYLNKVSCKDKCGGVTGSGKTFTMANVIEQLQKPTLIIAHNKTLAAQLYGEFKEMFPDNRVE